MDGKLLSRMLVDAHPKLVDIHARCGHPDVKQLSRRRTFKREMPLLIRLRGRDHCLPVGATELYRYAACGFVCSSNKNMTGQCATHGDFFCMTRSVEYPVPTTRRRTSANITNRCGILL